MVSRIRRARRRASKRRRERNQADVGLWLRLEGELSSCDACRSPEIRPLDVMRVRRATGSRLVFIVGCRACGLVFTSPMPSPEELEHFYGAEGGWAERHAGRTAKLASVHARRKGRPPRAKPAVQRPRDLLLAAVDRYVPVLNPEPGAKAIDVGCGDGKLLNALQDLGWETYGIEPSTGVAFLRHHRLDTLPADGSFAFGVLHHVLEHVPDPLALLQQMAAAIREGGGLFVSVPRLDTLPRHGDYRYCINGKNHLVAFTEVCLRGLLLRAGFSTVATLDDPALDERITNGQPLRLRLVARRTKIPAALPASPLQPALRAFSSYDAKFRGWHERVARLAPVRFRAGIAEWLR